MVNYIRQRYGNPEAAWAHEQAFNWYDNGGWLPSGHAGFNSSGKPEPVFSNSQWQILARNVKGSDDGAVLTELRALHADVVKAVDHSAHKSGAAFGDALNSMAGRVANRSRYQAGT